MNNLEDFMAWNQMNFGCHAQGELALLEHELSKVEFPEIYESSSWKIPVWVFATA